MSVAVSQGRRGITIIGLVAFLLLLSTSVLPAPAQHGGVNWTRDLSAALKDAQTAKKMVVIDVYTDW